MNSNQIQMASGYDPAQDLCARARREYYLARDDDAEIAVVSISLIGQAVVEYACGCWFVDNTHVEGSPGGTSYWAPLCDEHIGTEEGAMHAHTCYECGAVIEAGNFDCDIDAGHDFALCVRARRTGGG